MKKAMPMSTLIFALFVIAASLGLNSPSAKAQEGGPGFDISFHHVGISVPNMEESIAWYKKMFGFVRDNAGNAFELIQYKKQ